MAFSKDCKECGKILFLNFSQNPICESCKDKIVDSINVMAPKLNKLVKDSNEGKILKKRLEAYDELIKIANDVTKYEAYDIRLFGGGAQKTVETFENKKVEIVKEEFETILDEVKTKLSVFDSKSKKISAIESAQLKILKLKNNDKINSMALEYDATLREQKENL